MAGRGNLGRDHDVLELSDAVGDLASFDLVERLARGIRHVLELLVEAGLFEELFIGGIERGGGHVLLGGAFLIAEGFIDVGERLVGVEVVGVVLDGELEFLFGAVEVALFKQILGFVEMLLGLGLASADQRDCQQDRQ